MRRLLTLNQTAEKINAPVASVRYWRSRNQGPPMFRMGRRLVAFEDEIDRWLEDQVAADAARRGNPAPAA